MLKQLGIGLAFQNNFSLLSRSYASAQIVSQNPETWDPRSGFHPLPLLCHREPLKQLQWLKLRWWKALPQNPQPLFYQGESCQQDPARIPSRDGQCWEFGYLLIDLLYFKHRLCTIQEKEKIHRFFQLFTEIMKFID